jgi:hypothetical protein
VLLKNDIFRNDSQEKLLIGKEYNVMYGEEIFKAVLKMIGKSYKLYYTNLY